MLSKKWGVPLPAFKPLCLVPAERIAGWRLWMPVQAMLLVAGFLLELKQLLPVLKNQRTHVYESPSIVLAALARPGVIAAALLAAAIALLGMKRLRWSALGDTRLMRIPLSATALVLAFSFSTYDVNLYLGQTHTLDRLLVLALGVGVVFHPGVTPLFFVAVTLVLGQFSTPLGYSWADVALLFFVVMAATAWLALRLVLPMDARSLTYLWMCTVGAAYFDAAWRKWALSPHGWEWVFQNDIANLFVSSHLNGWLPDLSKEAVLAWGHRIHNVAVPMQVLTFGLEVLPALMIFSRRLTAFTLVALVGMHAGIFLASGILFWKWSIFDLTLAYVIWRHAGTAWPSYRWVLAVIAIPIVVFAGRLGVGSSLGWWDTTLSQFHTFHAVTDDGRRYRLDELDFAPLDKTIAQDRFFALHDEKQTTSTLGATNSYRRFRQLQEASPERVLEIMKTGGVKKNEGVARRFDHFVRTVMHARNRGFGHGYWLARFSGPMHIHHHAPSAERLPDGVAVRKVEVVFHEVLYTGDDLLVLKEKTVREIDIPHRGRAR